MSNESEKLKRGKAYPLSDRLGYREAENVFRLYGPRYNNPTGNVAIDSAGRLGAREQWIRNNIKAVWSGEKRPPKKGEWYLSGSEIVAYRAPNDLSTPYHIANIIRVETVITEVIHKITLDNGPIMGS